MRLHPACNVCTLLTVLLACTPGAPALVINEIHYNPPEGEQLEFIELFNPDPAPLGVGGWAFIRGIRYEFPESAVVPAQGYLVVCRHPELVATFFEIPVEALLGWGGWSLDNGGEKIALVDASGAVADEVYYEDTLPWDPDADGGGASLERLCARSDSNLAENWVALAGMKPTPMAPNHSTVCPAPAPAPPRVAINEIYYHPLNDQDAKHEFVELVNTTGEAVDLKNYCFSQGIDFCFGETTILEPGGFLVVCRNQDEVRTALNVARTAGNFAGQLSNDGERVTLLNPQGAVVDSVRYEDSGDWPVGADGLGFSLEKIFAGAPSDDPASWMDSGAVDSPVLEGWQTASVAGVATSDQLLIYIRAAGEFLIDNVSLVNTADPGTELLSNGGFDQGIDGWLPRGNHASSRWSRSPGGEIFDEAALHLIAAGTGSSVNCVTTQTVTPLDRTPGVTYRLTFSYIPLNGNRGLVARLSVATPSRGIYFDLGGSGGPVISAGEGNIARRDAVPPFVSGVRRQPLEPKSEDPIWITARVRGSATRVALTANLSGGPQEYEMLDDGMSSDGAAGDGVYGVPLPAQPHNTAVTFSIKARSAAGERLSPLRDDPMPVYGYYVNDNQPESKLPIFSFIIPAANARAWIAALNCSGYATFSFAYKGDLHYNVGIRRRGGSVCGSQKPFLKIRFHKGHELVIDGGEFKGHKNLNFQSLWTDKALIREHMSWDMFHDLGQPYLTHDYVRLHANGGYYGLYAAMERPDERWLARNGLNPEGNLYKATASREEATGTYEKKTNEREGDADLRDFLNSMHRSTTANLVSFFHERTDEDSIIDYQASQILINNADYPHKNHYLYHDTARGKWMVTAWDLDLTFGKYWDGTYGGVLNDRMDNPGLSPWYTTNVRGDGGGNFLLDKFFSQAGTWYRRAYLVRLWDAIREKYRLDFYEEKIVGFRELLFDEQIDDVAAWGRSAATANDRTAPAGFDPNLDRVRNHLSLRRDYLLNYLRTRESFTGHDQLKITEVMYNPSGDDDEAEYLELWNSSGRSIDISAWTIEGLGAVDLEGARTEFSFPAGTMLSAGEVFIVAKDPARLAARYPGLLVRVFGPYPGNLDNDGESLRIKDTGPGYPATADFLRYGIDGDWPVEANGFGYSLELTQVVPDRDNDLGVYWRASAQLSGSPGFVEGVTPVVTLFRRGDANADGQVDQTDAVYLLSYLFEIGAEPACLQSADTNLSGSLNLTDGVYLLNYLFLESAEPPPPFTACGPAESGEGLTCNAFPACPG